MFCSILLFSSISKCSSVLCTKQESRAALSFVSIGSVESPVVKFLACVILVSMLPISLVCTCTGALSKPALCLIAKFE